MPASLALKALGPRKLHMNTDPIELTLVSPLSDIAAQQVAAENTLQLQIALDLGCRGIELTYIG